MKQKKIQRTPEAVTGAELVATPASESGFINEDELIARLQISRGTASNHRKSGLLPFVKLGHAVRYHWPTVAAALLRQQRGGG